MPDFDTPQSRNEAILQNMLGADNELLPPQSRIEVLLQMLLAQGMEKDTCVIEEDTLTEVLVPMTFTLEDLTAEGGSPTWGISFDALHCEGKEVAISTSLSIESDAGTGNDVIVVGNIAATIDGEAAEMASALSSAISAYFASGVRYDAATWRDWTQNSNDYAEVIHFVMT